ncbi:cuticle protein 19 [Lepeophtheirus salmonis]|nr:cuticle protein 7-like [Lepeophtheirus salmonis]
MLRFVFILSMVAFAAVSADHAPIYHPEPYHPSPYDEPAKPYAFQYGVSDDYSGTQFSAQENSDAKVISGSYQVALPDGRVQTVTYTADDYAGFIADVKYEGTPIYPKYEPKLGYAPKSYKPAPRPIYKSAPKYRL